MAQFGEKLQKHIRQTDVVHYVDLKNMQPMNGEKLVLHVTMLGFNQAATTKPFPYPKVCIALADEYLTHTFLSSDEPLAVWMPHRIESSSEAAVMQCTKHGNDNGQTFIKQLWNKSGNASANLI